MPITPRFSLSQTADVVTIIINTPHVRVSATTLEVVVDGDIFHFYSSPYLLRLTLPGRLVDDIESGREAKAEYDISRDNGTVTVTAYKDEEDVGIWAELDLVGRLVVGADKQRNDRKDRSAGLTIEVIASECTDGPSCSLNGNGTTSGSATEGVASELLHLTAPRYGFLGLFHSVFTDLAREGLSHEMMEIPNPDQVPEEERRAMRLEAEGKKFNPDRYLEDLLLDMEKNHGGEGEGGSDMVYDEATAMIPHWMHRREAQADSINKLSQDLNGLSVDLEPRQSPMVLDILTELTSDETHLLGSIPPSHVPSIDMTNLTEAQVRSVLLTLIDILFAYAYDHRTTGGEPTVESSWSISILSPSLSWFEQYGAGKIGRSSDIVDSVADVLAWSTRRALIYPYLRSYSLAALAANDASMILQQGKRMVLRCLLQIRTIMENSTSHYLFNKLWIDPIIFWAQNVSHTTISAFAAEARKHTEEMQSDTTLWKCRLGLELQELEDIFMNEGSSEEANESESDDSVEDSSEDESDAKLSGIVCAQEETSSDLLRVPGNEETSVSLRVEDKLNLQRTEREIKSNKPLIEVLSSS